jgi:hypothetical protein
MKVDRAVCRNGTRLDEARQLAGVINVQVRQQYQVKRSQRGVRLTDARERAGTRVNQYPWLTIQQYEITRGGTSQGGGPAGTQYDQLERG